MIVSLENFEENVTGFFTNIIKSIFFFLNNNHQSLFVSIIHYIIFIVGSYYFLFKSEPKSLFRLLFFIFLALSTISYFVFNKCILTSIEFRLSNERNYIQKIINIFFGEKRENNINSKIFLSFLTFISGFILLNDYGILKLSY
jgi:hypothetical protein